MGNLSYLSLNDVLYSFPVINGRHGTDRRTDRQRDGRGVTVMQPPSEGPHNRTKTYQKYQRVKVAAERRVIQLLPAVMTQN